MIKKLLPKDPYGSHVTLVYGSREEMNKFLIKETGNNKERIRRATRAHTVTWTPDPTKSPTHYVLIVKDQTKDRGNRMASLGHELIHVVIEIFEFRGIKVDTYHDEPMAYYWEWLFRHCAREIW